MDYGKFLYEKSKSSKEQKKKQKVIQVKEIKFRPGTDDGDYQVKLRSLIRFLEDGDKPRSRCVFAAVRWPTNRSVWKCLPASVTI
ncbi:translation initiation factor IF-3 [Klebsiella michiganensis]|nr:translation initiation factor IF-3 [Klebsiella michiganensis]